MTTLPCYNPLYTLIHLRTPNSFLAPPRFTRKRCVTAAATSSRINAQHDDIEAVPPARLPPLPSTEALHDEAEWVGGLVRCWLDEEWTPQEVHQDLGAAASAVYVQIRAQGPAEIEVGDVLLGLSSGLLAFNFRDCFVGPFDVANKVVELLMLRSGAEVCCISPADQEAIARYERIMRQERDEAP